MDCKLIFAFLQAIRVQAWLAENAIKDCNSTDCLSSLEAIENDIRRIRQQLETIG